MAKIKVTGNAAVITSAIKFADIEKAEKYRPDALKLKDEEGKNEIFAISIGINPQANGYGIVFDGKTHDENGYATYTQLIPCIEEGLEEAIADFYGEAILKLNKLEEVFDARIKEIDDERKAILSQIELA